MHIAWIFSPYPSIHWRKITIESKPVIRERDTLIFKESLHFSDGHINTIYRTLYFDSIVINITLGKNVRIPIMDVEMNNMRVVTRFFGWKSRLKQRSAMCRPLESRRRHTCPALKWNGRQFCAEIVKNSHVENMTVRQ